MKQTRRTERARAALRTSSTHTEYLSAGRTSDADRRAALRDLLTDLRHYCDAYGLDYLQADRTAHDHYLTERGPIGPQS